MALKPTKYSYSKLNTYASCPWKYNLCYNEGHYIFTESIATLWGTLVHFIEENIGNALAAGEPVDYEKLKQDFVNINICSYTATLSWISIMRRRFTDMSAARQRAQGLS